MPIYQAMKATEDYVKITLYQVAALKDWRLLMHHLSENPTPVQILVSEYLDYLQYTYACQLVLDGLITPVLHSIQLWVWKYAWPQDIQN